MSHDHDDDFVDLGLDPLADVLIDEDDIGRTIQETFEDNAQLTDAVLDAASSKASNSPFFSPAEPQPINRATHICLRGPCVHYWDKVSRMPAAGDKIRLQATYHCGHHAELLNLGETNMYNCGQWWPAWLGWIPASLRAALRPYLTKLYVVVLKRMGYDFTWKHWDDDAFYSDRPELRKDGGLGGTRITNIDKER